MTDNNIIQAQKVDTDEIDLFELASNLWREKWIIIAFTVVATIIAIIYALMATPIYQTKAEALPPRISDIVALNPEPQQEDTVLLKPLKTSDVFNLFSQVLNSASLRNEFYEAVYLPSLTEEARNKPAEALRKELGKIVEVKLSSKSDEPDVVTVTLPNDPNKAQEWANLYITMAGDKARNSLVQDRSAEVANIVSALTTNIGLLRSQAKMEREREIARLSEAYYIAKEIGIEEPQKPDGKMLEEGANYIDRNLPYLRGTKALAAQLYVLQNRKDDDPFIPELSNLQQQLNFYQSLQFNSKQVSAYTFDHPAELPDFPIKPKKSLIVVIGFLLGGMIGVGVALVRVMIRNRRESIGV